jgi:hypothetical protein
MPSTRVPCASTKKAGFIPEYRARDALCFDGAFVEKMAIPSAD